MNTLYIHGLHSVPKKNKLRILSSFNLEPISEHIIYENTPTAYSLLGSLIEKHKVEFIIGSSLGGYLGFWLAEDFGLPCLLFNPAIIFDGKPELIIPEIEIGKSPLRLIVQGKKDKIVDSAANMEFLKQNILPHQEQKIISFDRLEHTIDLVTFEISVHWALESLIKLNKK